MLLSIGFVSLHFSQYGVYVSSLALSSGLGVSSSDCTSLNPYTVFGDLKLKSASLEPCGS